MLIYENLVNLYLNENYTLNESPYGPYHLISGLYTGGGITKKEILYIQKYKDEFISPKIFIIGNAFGFSTFAFSQIFKNSSIDVIDAEVEGTENKIGSNITRTIAEKNNIDVNLTIGFSPQDVNKSLRYKKYDIVFIDGLHTNQQLVLDFDSIKNYLNLDKYICFMHDVRLFNMESAFNDIIDKNNHLYDDYIASIDESMSESGIGIISKGVKIIK